MERVEVLRIKIPEMDAYLRDILKLIQYDALPEGIYKELASISGKLDVAKSVLHGMLPRAYVSEKIQSIHQDEANDHIIYLSEQFL
jgi:hypothetical protein